MEGSSGLGVLAVAIPNNPRGIATAVKILKFLQLLECIHAGPEAVVSVRKKLSFGNQPAEGLFHKFLAFLDISEDLAPKDKETAVNPSSRFGDVFDALHDSIAIDRNHMETRPGLDADETGQPFTLEEDLDQLVKVHIAEPVTVVGEKYLFISQMFLDCF